MFCRYHRRITDASAFYVYFYFVAAFQYLHLQFFMVYVMLIFHAVILLMFLFILTYRTHHVYFVLFILLA